MYLEDSLGSEEAFQLVYAYVIREENGDCEDAAEREALFASLGDKRAKLLPLVYTLAYMEDTLSACGMSL
jgi:hypothetical protein